jgi:hypothetical protein
VLRSRVVTSAERTDEVTPIVLGTVIGWLGWKGMRASASES